MGADIAKLKGLLRIEAENYLLERFGRIRDRNGRPYYSKQGVEAHLGHPVEEMTGEEYDKLEQFLDRAETAQRNQKGLPPLTPATKKAPKRR